MNKILIDDKFYRNTLETEEYLDNLLNVIKEYFDAEIIIFEPFYKNNKTYHFTSNIQLINKKIFKTHKSKKYDSNKVIEVTNNLLYDKLLFSEELVKKINYLLLENTEDRIIIPLVYNIQNRRLPIKKYSDRVFIIGNYDEEVESNISDWIENNEVICIPSPTIDNKFPAQDLCGRFDNWRSNILQPNYDGDKISDLSAIGIEVAKRNRYKYDASLTAINKRYAKKDKNGNSPKRQVFQNNKKSVYLSTDFENGGFEVYDKNATHQGQYRFNGNFEKKADENSHKLYLK